MQPDTDKKEEITQETLGTLHKNEIDLIFLIRTKCRFGSIEVITREGLPDRVSRILEFQKLGMRD